MVLVHRPTHCAARAGSQERQRRPHRHHLGRIPEDLAGIHLRAAGDHRRRVVLGHPGRVGRCGVPGAGHTAPAGRVQRPGAGGDARRADELARVRVQLLLDAAHVGRVPQASARRERAAARGRRAHHHRTAGRLGSLVDSVHEVHLTADLYLSAERAGLHRAADRRVLPARRAVPEAERHRRAGGALDRARARDGATRARARAWQSGERDRLGLVRYDQLPALRGPVVRPVRGHPGRGQLRDSAASARQDRRPDVRRTGRHRGARTGGAAPAQHRALGGACRDDRDPLDRVQMRTARLGEVRGGWGGWRRLVQLAAGLCVAVACSRAPSTTSRTSSNLPQPAFYNPAHDLGSLFQAVQLSGIFEDSKTFADARPRFAPQDITARYVSAQRSPQFNLREFVAQQFELPRPVGEGFRSDPSQTMEQHIRALWPVLTRPPDSADARSSLIPLPNAYVVPGGRFREVYYWDSYFTMLGLIESGRTDLVKSMLDNFAYLIRTVGHIPNGNRTYYLSRSQPPFFAAMVGLYAAATDTTQALRYLDAVEAEHAFWMDGAERVAPGEAYRRVVRRPDGSVLNRYWDDRAEPRPESYRPDYELAQALPEAQREAFYRNVRATAESGWDFSSRWMRDPKDLRTLETTELVPVDLNSLLYHAEVTIAALRRVRGRTGDREVAERFARAAQDRRRVLLAAAYDPATGYFYDVRWQTGARVADRPTIAAAAPLYFGLATPEQGRAVAARLAREFLKPGGCVPTLIAAGQQSDAP